MECINCNKKINVIAVGTANRNHCPICFWSKHVDENFPGDRKAKCQTGMKPIGLTFKIEGKDKWGKKKQGELMLVHECCECGKISINRISGDDNPEEIIQVLKTSEDLNKETKDKLKQTGIRLLTSDDSPEINTQLFGK